MKEARLTSDLPERYARLYHYSTGKFETPLDIQGIADIDAVFELAILTYPDQLPDFSTTEFDVHHIYWTEEHWRRLALAHDSSEREIIQTFREATPQKAYVPRVIHKWIEEVMIRPPVPPLEVMDRRNNSWEVANILLDGAILVDQARRNYAVNKNNIRVIMGNIDGVTPRSQQKDFDTQEIPEREYWLSELYRRLEDWRMLAGIVNVVPVEDRLVIEPRLWAVRALRRRINHRHQAIVPRVPELLKAA